eukprot:COSAG02_NODE_52566_length_307_cov_0.668269_1_plen_33_part_01
MATAGMAAVFLMFFKLCRRAVLPLVGRSAAAAC